MGQRELILKAKHREEERLFKIAQAQNLYVVKIAHFGTFICVALWRGHTSTQTTEEQTPQRCFDVMNKTTPPALHALESAALSRRTPSTDVARSLPESARLLEMCSLAERRARHARINTFFLLG
jgi:hypothetical protein